MMPSLTFRRRGRSLGDWRLPHARGCAPCVFSPMVEPLTSATEPALQPAAPVSDSPSAAVAGRLEAQALWAHWPSGGSTFATSDVLCVEILEEGRDGVPVRPRDTVSVHYACLLAGSGGCVDASRSKAFSERGPMIIKLGTQQVVDGMERGVQALQLGTIARLHVPPRFGYAEHSAGPIPPNAHLVFEVEVVAINGREASKRDSWSVRRLLMLPPLPLPTVDAKAAAGGQLTQLSKEAKEPPVVIRHSAEEVAAATAAARQDEKRFLDSDSEAIGAAALPLHASPNAADAAVPCWLSRLRSILPLPLPYAPLRRHARCRPPCQRRGGHGT